MGPCTFSYFIMQSLLQKQVELSIKSVIKVKKIFYEKLLLEKYKNFIITPIKEESISYMDQWYH